MRYEKFLEKHTKMWRKGSVLPNLCTGEMVNNHNYSYVLIQIVVLFSQNVYFVDFYFVLLFVWQDTLRVVLNISG